MSTLSATTPSSRGVPSLSSLLGPFLVEALVCSLLLGITLVQAKTYFERCGNDPTILVLAVALLWILHLFHNVCMSHTIWSFAVSHFGDYAALTIPPWSFGIGATLTGIASFIVQFYYARQVYVLGHRRVLVPMCIIILSFLSLLFSVLSTVKGYSYGDFRRFSEFEWGVFIWLLSAAAADVLLTSALVYYLRRHRQETEFQDTKSLLNKVISNTVENNLITCLVACIDAVVFGLYRRLGNWHVVLNGMLVGLYFISFLTSLNAKHSFAERQSSIRNLSSLANVPKSQSDNSGDRHVDLTESSQTRRPSHGLIQVISRASFASLSKPKSADQGGGKVSSPPAVSHQFALYRIDDAENNKRAESVLTDELIDPQESCPETRVSVRAGPASTMPLKLLHHKSYHVYNAENIARVQRDEAEAARAEDEREQRSMQADSEARLDRMRHKLDKSKRKRQRDQDDDGEKALDKQLTRGRSSRASGDDQDDSRQTRTNGTVIVRPGDRSTASRAVAQPLEHINFWKELEAGGGGEASLDQQGTSRPVSSDIHGSPCAQASKPLVTEAQLQKAIEKDKLEAMTRMYIAKRGEGEPKGWYASEDGQTEAERKRNEEAKLERAYKDGEQKRMTDPLAQMQAYLARRDDILAGRQPASTRRSHTYRERYLEPATPSERGNDRSVDPVVPSLLAPRKRDPARPTLSPPGGNKGPSGTSTQASSRSKDPVTESTNRVTSERARAQALIAQRKRAALAATGSASPSTIRGGNDTPRSDWDNMFNRDAVKEARERRDYGRTGQAGRNEQASSFSWTDQKRNRNERVGSRRW
ncbi:hypothetical protein OIV83_002115 [Microbotryomycetes sp. JL201]|nr:hypothetical protein OIV83_002115 [Microbotryomycetes sp. JL201]